ncbi:HAD family hydrolase [Aureivirga sp. CE67]|uniref:HAD family hydrolase n=1 Tax=Aureivirga sp. CE67 TaxID=1788983 RepID=UPI0018CA0EA0|nr:HAD family hydrolase [Aureivirga sp. CE67]
MKKTLAIFDFDGTLTTKDTMFEFIKFTHGKTQMYVGLLLRSFYIKLYLIKIISNEKLKEIVMDYFYEGKLKEWLEEQAVLFFEEKGLEMMRDEAVEKLKWHQKENHDVFIVSASINIWVEPFAKYYGVKLISTEFDYTKGIFNGKLGTKNCYGEEKVNRISEVVDLASYEDIYAYGDSSGDKGILRIANHKFYKSF